jgi:guanylate kinase
LVKKTFKKKVPVQEGSLFIVSAPSGAGKTTLCKELCRAVPRLKFSVSYTTRPRRRGERNAVHYHFVSQSSFKGMIKKGDFAEWAVVFGNHYGTSIKTISKINKEGYDIILDIDTNGAIQMKRKYKDAIYIFVLPPSLKTLQNRIRGRKSESNAEIKRRLSKAGDEMLKYKEYDFIVINDDLNKAVRDLKCIIAAERLRTGRLDTKRIKKLIK